MDQLKNIKHSLVSAVQTQLGDLKKTDAKELGEVIDAIKDIEEAMYYCAITKAMEESKEKKEVPQQYSNINYYMEPTRYYGNGGGMMGQSDGNSNSNGGNSMRNYTPYMEYAPYMMAAHYQNDDNGNMRSYSSRRMYMETKNDPDHSKASRELEHYFQDLASEINEMIQGSSNEDKQLLVTKLTWLANKINNNE